MLQRRFPPLLLLVTLVALFGLPSIPQSARATTANANPAVAPAPGASVIGSPAVSNTGDSIELLGGFGGRLNALAINGTWLYVTHNGGFTVFDISDPNQPVRRGFIMLPYVVDAGEYVNGLVYVATAKGLYIIDVSNPDQPAIRGSYNLSPTELPNIIFDLQVVGTRLYLLYHNRGGDNDPYQLQIFDVSNANQITALGTYKQGLWPSVSEIEVVGSYVYLTRTPNSLTVINATDPNNLTLHAIYPNFGSPANMARSGDYLFMDGVDNQLQIVDVSNPASPVLHDTYEAPDLGISDLKVHGNRAYIASVKLPNLYDLRILDVSNPASVTLLGTYATDLQPVRNLLVAGNLVYLHSNEFWSSAIQIVDVANPASPASRGRLRTPYTAEDVDVVGTTAYIASREAGLFIVDVSDPAQPRLRSVLPPFDNESLNAALKLQVVGNLAYVASNNTFRIVDVSNPDNPVVRAQIPVNSYQIQVHGIRAYVIGSSTFSIIDISNPDNPVEILRRNLNPSYWPGYDIDLFGNLVYLSGGLCANGCRGGVEILDISDETTPVVVGSVNGSFGDVEVTADVMYLQTQHYQYIYDLADLTTPTLRHTWDAPRRPQAMEIVGQRAYFAGGFFGGLQIADLGVPTVPKLKASYQSPLQFPNSRRATGIKLMDDLVYVADDYNGLLIFRIHPEQFPSSIFVPVIGKPS